MSDPQRDPDAVDRSATDPAPTDLTGGERIGETGPPATAEPDQEDLAAEVADQERRGWPDAPTTS